MFGSVHGVYCHCYAVLEPLGFYLAFLFGLLLLAAIKIWADSRSVRSNHLVKAINVRCRVLIGCQLVTLLGLRSSMPTSPKEGEAKPEITTPSVIQQTILGCALDDD